MLTGEKRRGIHLQKQENKVIKLVLTVVPHLFPASAFSESAPQMTMTICQF
jgi:hypothetical protein